MHPHLTDTRIARAIELIRDRIYSERLPLAVEMLEQVGEPFFPTTPPSNGFAPAGVGHRWGRAWSTVWFRFRAEAPAAWKGRNIVALVNLGRRAGEGEGFTAEGLVWHEGRPQRALNVNRRNVPIASPAHGGEKVDFLVEAAGNPSPRTWLPYGDPESSAGGPLFMLEQAELACFEPEAWDLYHDLGVAHGALRELPVESPRRALLLRACNDAANLLDPSDPRTWPAAREALREELSRANGPTAHRISATGHAHIDTAWLWPLRETIRKCARTFATQLACMAEDPAHVFACSSPQHYAWMKEYYPGIFAGIREAVARGQWEPVGSMWVEADCNIPSGESLARQLLHGKNFFLDEFGVETGDCWLPDVFGFNAALPGILAGAGVHSFLSQKLSWNEYNEFPHHTFLWEGLDGTRIFSHFPPSGTYNGKFTPAELAGAARDFKNHGCAGRSLYLFGFGDGGGGPTREMLAVASRVGDMEGLPPTRIEKAAEFFARAKADARDLPVWVGELYLERHRGTYTSQARAKLANRRGELALREAELFDVLAGRGSYAVEPGVAEARRGVYDVVARGVSTPGAYLERAWKLLLLNQFHDILPGSSTARVYRENQEDHGTITELAAAVAGPARESLLGRIDTSGAARPVIVFNTTGVPRSEVVALGDGTLLHVDVPPCGYIVADAAEQRPVASFAHPVEVSERRRLIAIDNGMLRVLIDRESGNIRAIRDHRFHREVLDPDCEGNVFQLHRDLPDSYDAWDIDAAAFETRQDICGPAGIEVVEHGGLRATVRVSRRFGGSTISQLVRLCAGSVRIDFHTEVDWRERHWLLKVAFPLNVRSSRATYETQYGHVERPTHANTSWDEARYEVCAQRWADLGEGDYGVALLNDCKHGYDIRGNVMRLSLLRAPTAPDADADQGRHEFTYALLPHAGCFRKGAVIEQACALNAPLHVVETRQANVAPPAWAALPARASFIECERPGLYIEAVKHAEREEAVIVRLYEGHGTRGEAAITTRLPVKHAFLSDLLERGGMPLGCDGGRIEFSVRPFEIVTLKLISG